MVEKRKQYSAPYKFKVALEAAKGSKTIRELASETGVHPTQISQWKKQLLEEGANLFSRNGFRQGGRHQDQQRAANGNAVGG